MIARCRWLPAVLALAAVGPYLAAGPRAVGQGLTPDPYNIVGEYNGQYAPFMYPLQPQPGSPFPNQSRMQERAGYRNANRFQGFMDSLDGAEIQPELPALTRRPGLGTPYYRANRQYDSVFGRVYQPNRDADESFYSSLDDRNSTYFRALREKDPRKRAQLLRQFNLERLRSARTLSSNRGRDQNLDRQAPPPSGSPSIEGDPLLGPLPSRSRGPRRDSSALPSTAPPPSTSWSPDGSRTGRGLPATRSPLLDEDDLLGPSPARRSPTDVLDRSERLDRGTRGTTPRRSALPGVAPPPPR